MNTICHMMRRVVTSSGATSVVAVAASRSAWKLVSQMTTVFCHTASPQVAIRQLTTASALKVDTMNQREIDHLSHRRERGVGSPASTIANVTSMAVDTYEIKV